jgi:HEAT repeat protein
MLLVRRDPDSLVRSTAAAALGSVGDERTRETLEDATKDDAAEVREAARRALKEQQQRRGVVPPNSSAK